MADIFESVKPGDLITADLMNRLLETVEGLDGRVAALETATKGSISGTVKDITNGQPIVGAIVKAILGNVTFNSTPSDSQGIFTIADLLPGDYTVIATAENYLQSPAQTVGIAPGIPRVANFLLNRTAGLVAVPKLFGLTLGEARTVVRLPSVNMELGTIITSHGAVLTVEDAAAQNRVILNQVPGASAAVPSGTKIDVVVSGNGDGGTGTGTGSVAVRAFIPPTEAAIGQDLTIVGENFVVPVSGNTVTIGGVRITDFLAGSNNQNLKFIIPTIPDVPVGGRSVLAVVENSNGRSERTYRVLPPIEAPGLPPVINGVTGPGGTANTLRVGQPFTIAGENFAENPQDNIIQLDNIAVTQINSAQSSTAQIVATVPEIAGLPATGKLMTLSVRVGEHPAATRGGIRVFPA